MKQEARYVEFFDRVDMLDKGDRAALRRSIGTMISQADGKALRAFYRCITPAVPQKQEDKWFAVACIKCLWEPGKSAGVPMEELLAQMIRSQELSESIKLRVAGLLDTSWYPDGVYLLGKLGYLTKMLYQKNGKQIDFAKLLEDLIFWDSEKQTVQRNWSRCIFSEN